MPYPRDLIRSAPLPAGEIDVEAEIALCTHYNRRRLVPGAESERDGDAFRLRRFGADREAVTPLEALTDPGL